MAGEGEGGSVGKGILVKIKVACEQSLVVNQIAAEIVHVTEERVYISSSPRWAYLHVCTYPQDTSVRPNGAPSK